MVVPLCVMLLTAQIMWTYGHSNPSIKTSFSSVPLYLTLAHLAGVLLLSSIWSKMDSSPKNECSVINIVPNPCDFLLFFHEMQKEMFWILVTLLHTMKTDQAKKGWTKRKTKRTIQVCMTWMQYWKSSNNSFMWGNLATVHWKVFFFCCSKIRIINLINIKHEKFLEIVILLVPYVFENIFITWNKINKT